MNKIIIKTFIDTPAYTIDVVSIPEPEDIIKKVIRKIKKEPRKEYKVAGQVNFERITVKIIDEVNIHEWMDNLINSSKIMDKREIEAKTKEGFTYLFKGCFPVAYNANTQEATFSVDCFVIGN
jgi:hypothetical protein